MLLVKERSWDVDSESEVRCLEFGEVWGDSRCGRDVFIYDCS